MKALKTLSIMGFALLLAACHPRIYQFSVDPKSIGPNDPVRVSWQVKGKATLLIHDINYPGSGNVKLQPLTLQITQDGKVNSFMLYPDSTLKILLAGEDSLRVDKKPDSNTDDRLRYITLVVTRNGQDSSRVIQVAVRPDAAKDEIAFRTIIRGDSIVAMGINNPVRWGDAFNIQTVSDVSNRVMDIVHSNISQQLRPGDPPDNSFNGTPVRGNWVFRSLMTAEEKNDHRLVPNFLKLSITIKHH